jgi:nucleotide-binding universal stress UspA family protein
MGQILLALSTFRQSERAVEKALEMAAGKEGLIVVHVVDVNVSRYIVDTDLGMFSNLKNQVEGDFLKEQKEVGEEKVREIAGRAAKKGIQTKTCVRIGRFGLECMEIVKKERPEAIVTTRAKRPDWVRRFFGSPVDYLIANAGCPVLEF